MKRLCYSLFCFLVALCRAEYPQSVREIFKDDAQLDVLYHPDRIEVCIWHPKPSSAKWDPGFLAEAYDAGKYVPLPPNQAALVTWKLTTDENYLWNEVVDGEHILHARFRYSNGKHTLTADLNFSSGIVIYSFDGKGFSDGRLRSEADWIFQVVERTFPNDKVVQSVRKRKELERSYKLDIEIAKATEAQKKREANHTVEPSSPSRVGSP